MVAYNFKRRFVAPLAMGLGLPCPAGFEPVGVEVRPKRQTMRTIGKRRCARVDEMVQLYWGMRTRQCLKIGEAVCSGSGEVSLAFGSRPSVSIGLDLPGSRRVETYSGPGPLDDFARTDGFENWDDLARFWHDENGAPASWSGWIIRWEPVTP